MQATAGTTMNVSNNFVSRGPLIELQSPPSINNAYKIKSSDTQEIQPNDDKNLILSAMESKNDVRGTLYSIS